MISSHPPWRDSNWQCPIYNGILDSFVRTRYACFCFFKQIIFICRSDLRILAFKSPVEKLTDRLIWRYYNGIFLSVKGFKSTVVNRTLQSWHERSFEITLVVRFKSFVLSISPQWFSNLMFLNRINLIQWFWII